MITSPAAQVTPRTVGRYVAGMAPLTGKAAQFLALHLPGDPLLQLNAFDGGSARVLESIGIKAIATTSSGFAATRGRLDGDMTLEKVLSHCAFLAGLVTIPVAADFENAFADAPDGVAANVARAAQTGLAGCSVEDWSGSAIYDFGVAAERIAAAAEAAHNGATQLVLTARAENHIRGGTDLADTISRLQAYQEAGADVLFAPGVRDINDIATIVRSVDRPVNVLAGAGSPTVAELAAVGVARISVGGALSVVGYAAVVDAAREVMTDGTFMRIAEAMESATEIRSAFG